MSRNCQLSCDFGRIEQTGSFREFHRLDEASCPREVEGQEHLRSARKNILSLPQLWGTRQYRDLIKTMGSVSIL